MNLASVPRNNLQDRMQVGAMPHSTVLPQTQAGPALRSRTRLCPIPMGAWNQMTPDQFNGISEATVERQDVAVRGGANAGEDAGANIVARSKIVEGARAVNRLWWSLWLLLLPLIWPSSDWIGLIILSQAFFVAAKLIQPTIEKTKSAASPVNAVMSMERGEDCAQG